MSEMTRAEIYQMGVASAQLGVESVEQLASLIHKGMMAEYRVSMAQNNLRVAASRIQDATYNLRGIGE